MKKYTVNFVSRSVECVEVEAENRDEAIEKAFEEVDPPEWDIDYVESEDDDE